MHTGIKMSSGNPVNKNFAWHVNFENFLCLRRPGGKRIELCALRIAPPKNFWLKKIKFMPQNSRFIAKKWLKYYLLSFCLHQDKPGGIDEDQTQQRNFNAYYLPPG